MWGRYMCHLQAVQHRLGNGSFFTSFFRNFKPPFDTELWILTYSHISVSCVVYSEYYSMLKIDEHRIVKIIL